MVRGWGEAVGAEGWGGALEVGGGSGLPVGGEDGEVVDVDGVLLPSKSPLVKGGDGLLPVGGEDGEVVDVDGAVGVGVAGEGGEGDGGALAGLVEGIGLGGLEGVGGLCERGRRLRE